MTTSLPDYRQQSQSNQSQMQSATPTGNYHSNNPFLNAQPTGASIGSTATAPPSFSEAINDTNNRIPTSDPPPVSAQNTSAASNPFDDLSNLDPEQHMNTTSTSNPQINSSSTPSGVDSRVTSSQTGVNHRAQNPSPSPPISPIEAQSPRPSTSPPSSPEVQSHQRPQTPPLIIPPDVDSPPDPSSTSTTTTVYNPPSEPPPPVSTSTSTPVVYQPPPNPPPRHPHGRTTSNSSSSHASPSMNNGSTQDTWRPTTIPTPGQPLLRNGRILVYPAGFHCPKCQNTGFKKFDPTHPCRKCWEKYSKEFTNAVQSSIGLSGSNLQKPLPIHSPPNQTNYNYSQGQGLIGRPMSHSNVPGGYPAQSQTQYRPAPGHFQVQQHQSQPYHPNTHYRPPTSNPPPPPQQQQNFRPGPPAVNRADSASEGLDGDAPPNYNEVVTSNRPLPPQSTGSSSSGVSGNSFRPPPGPPPVPQHHGSSYGPPQGYHQPHQQGYGYGHPGHHQHQHHPPHHQPPPRPLVLQPGDPRIGGQLCYKCGGRGLKESFWFGDEQCLLCNGIGRTFR